MESTCGTAPTRPTRKETLAVTLGLAAEGKTLSASLGFSFAAGYEAGQTGPEVFLHPRELARWQEFAFPLRRKSYWLGRRAAKAALGVSFPTLRPAEIEIANGVFNQPFFRDAGVAAELSLAHAPHAAVALIFPAGHPAGVDLEQLELERSDAAASCFTPAERPVIAGLGLPAATAHYLLWSIKEALGKALRVGLAVPFETLAIGSAEAGPGGIECLFLHFPSFKAQSWFLGDYVLSIVLPRNSTLTFEPPAELEGLLRVPVASGA